MGWVLEWKVRITNTLHLVLGTISVTIYHLPAVAVPRERNKRTTSTVLSLILLVTVQWIFSLSYLHLCSLYHYAALSGGVEWLLVLWYYVYQ